MKEKTKNYESPRLEVLEIAIEEGIAQTLNRGEEGDWDPLS